MRLSVHESGGTWGYIWGCISEKWGYMAPDTPKVKPCYAPLRSLAQQPENAARITRTKGSQGGPKHRAPTQATLTYLLPAAGTRNFTGRELPACEPARKDPGHPPPSLALAMDQPQPQPQPQHQPFQSRMHCRARGARITRVRTTQEGPVALIARPFPSGCDCFLPGTPGTNGKTARNPLSSLNKVVPGSTGDKRQSAGDTGDK